MKNCSLTITFIVSLVTIGLTACGGGGSNTTSNVTQSGVAKDTQCGPVEYINVRVIPESLRCDSDLVATYVLEAGPSGQNYDSFIIRENLVQSISTCNGAAPRTAAGFSLTNNAWADDNGIRNWGEFKDGCVDRSIIEDQWRFDTSRITDLAGAQEACRGGFTLDNYKTFATKQSIVSRSGSVFHSCKIVTNGRQACIDFDVNPNLGLSNSSIFLPASGGSDSVEVAVLLSGAATDTCRKWTINSTEVPWVTVKGEAARRRVETTSIEIAASKNTGSVRSGYIRVKFDETGVERKIYVEQDCSPEKCQNTRSPIATIVVEGVIWSTDRGSLDSGIFLSPVGSPRDGSGSNRLNGMTVFQEYKVRKSSLPSGPFWGGYYDITNNAIESVTTTINGISYSANISNVPGRNEVALNLGAGYVKFEATSDSAPNGCVDAGFAGSTWDTLYNNFIITWSADQDVREVFSKGFVREFINSNPINSGSFAVMAKCGRDGFGSFYIRKVTVQP